MVYLAGKKALLLLLNVPAQSALVVAAKGVNLGGEEHRYNQCCGSGSESGSTGSTCFWDSWIRIRIYKSEVSTPKCHRSATLDIMHQCSGSLTFLVGSWSLNPYPALPVRGLQDAKCVFFVKFFCLVLSVGIFTSVFKDKS